MGRSDSVVVSGMAEGKEKWRKVIRSLGEVDVDMLYRKYKAARRGRKAREGREIRGIR